MTKLYVIHRELETGIGIVIQTLDIDGKWYIATNSALKLPYAKAKHYKRIGIFIERVLK